MIEECERYNSSIWIILLVCVLCDWVEKYLNFNVESIWWKIELVYD